MFGGRPGQATAEMPIDARLASNKSRQSKEVKKTDFVSKEQLLKTKLKENQAMIADGTVVAGIPLYYRATNNLFKKSAATSANWVARHLRR